MILPFSKGMRMNNEMVFGIHQRLAIVSMDRLVRSLHLGSLIIAFVRNMFRLVRYCAQVKLDICDFVCHNVVHGATIARARS